MVAESTRTVRHLGVHSWRSRRSQCPVHNHHTVSQNHHHHKCHRQRTVAHLYMSLSRGNQRVRMVAACRSGDDQSLVDGPSRQLLEAAGLQQCLTGAAAWPAALQQTALAAKSPNFLPPIIRIYRTRTHAHTVNNCRYRYEYIYEYFTAGGVPYTRVYMRYRLVTS